jgi:2-methylisocitrate lyase-like PEP mutase family enzyme
MTVSQKDKAAAFRVLHQGPGAFVIPNPYDIGTTRILTALGFKALATTSAGFAFSIGRLDGAVTREEALAHCRTIVEATHLPVSADLENGFGDAPEAAAETVRLAAGVGLVGCSIEDATGDPAHTIYDFDLAVERVAAAVAAARRLDFPFTLTARAENFLRGRPDLEDTVRRLQAFEKVGADCLYAPALRDIATIRTVCGAVSKPVNVLMGSKGNAIPVAELAAAGARRISVGGALACAALGGFLRAAREIKEHGTFAYAEHSATHGEISAFMAGRE